MKRFIPAVFCLISAAGPVLGQAGNQPLAGLIQAGNRGAALDRIRAGADVNEAQPDGTRPIHWAVYRVDYELLEALIAKEADVNVVNSFGSTPIAEAAAVGDVRMVKLLLDAGAEPEGANADGQTALMLAIKIGAVPVVEALLDAGASVNTIEKFQQQTPLMWAAAAAENAGEMVRLLVSKGADVEVRAQYNDWPSQITSEPRAQYLPVGGLTALLYAARNGCYDCVEALIDGGADVNVPTPEGVTPLMIALDNDHNGVAKLLLDRGANPNLWDWWGRTALYIAVDRKAAGGGRGGRGGGARDELALEPPGSGPAVSSLEIITALLDAGVELNPQLNMHRPSRQGNSGRFIDPFLNTGCTPLMRATVGKDIEAVRVLLERGASPNISAMGLTPFQIAAGVGTGGLGTGLAAQTSAGGPPDPPLMDLLLQYGADVNAQITGTLTYSLRVARSPSANEGKTALHHAVEKGNADLVRYLLEHGAKTGLLDDSGRKPIDLLDGDAEGAAGIRALLEQ